MIGPILTALRDLVVAPQADAPPERRIYLDPAGAPVNVVPQSADIVAVSSVPLGVEIPLGLRFAHTVDVVVTVEHSTVQAAMGTRDLIVTDLALRSLTVDWPNLDLGGEFDRADGPTIRYAEGTTDDPDTLAAYAVMTFTVETTVRP